MTPFTPHLQDERRRRYRRPARTPDGGGGREGGIDATMDAECQRRLMV